MKTITLNDVLVTSQALADRYPKHVGIGNNQGCFGGLLLMELMKDSPLAVKWIKTMTTPGAALEHMMFLGLVSVENPHQIMAVLGHMMNENDAGMPWADVHHNVLLFAERNKILNLHDSPETQEEELPAAAKVAFVDSKGKKLFGFLPVKSWFKKDPMDQALEELLEQEQQEKTLTSV